MKDFAASKARIGFAAAAIALVAGSSGYAIAHLTTEPSGIAASGEGKRDPRKPLYWFDPMVPDQHFDHPGKSPFMDMLLVPKYADAADDDAQGVRIDPAATQNLGLRTVSVRRGELANAFTATGTLDFNQRDVAIVQARSGGFVQRVYGRAPGDVIGANAPIADILIPEWAGAQAEYLAVRRTGNSALTLAARQRLMLLGMPSGLIASIDRNGKPRTVITVSTPTAGVIKTLGVRAGMTLASGQTLAEINGLGTVWLNAAVPEALAGRLRPGQLLSATLPAYPGETFSGKIAAVLPDVQTDSRTLTVRAELSNPSGRLKPGMFASVTIDGENAPSLLVPSEAVIRTGKRTLVVLALANGRYRPAEVQPGRDNGGVTEILAGLSEGEKIVASGQFLIDSEANLSGIAARPVSEPHPPATLSPSKSLFETTGKIEQITSASITLSHDPVPALGWPAMTMTFALPNPAVARGFSVGDHIRFGFDRPPAGPAVRQLIKVAGR
ncbi:efflux RND transporter periplasmic adaptor subunit [Novosphingobium sp.]|uniref:efflux RND transporter periplasmic adaptor subunit n=1 Tax=Novosphingobium sp. TaxID=1874826 RepID=UPI002FE30405